MYILSGLETNARPLARGELNSVRASGSSDLTSPVGEWEFYRDLSTIVHTVIACLTLISSGLRLKYKILCNDDVL